MKYLITAAGGNATAIEEIEKSGRDLPARGHQLLADWQTAEQAGFLDKKQKGFTMAGGEFCGNATRAAAVLLSNSQSVKGLKFRTSGFDSIVLADVEKLNDRSFYVKARFPNMKITVKKTIWNQQNVTIVSLGGIVQAVIEVPEPKDSTAALIQFIRDNDLESELAVGMVWTEITKTKVKITPIVWVRDSKTLFRETSCGSGAIAAAIATGKSNIAQPTGQIISANIGADYVELASSIEIIDRKGEQWKSKKS